MNQNINSSDLDQNPEHFPQTQNFADILDSMFTLYRNNYRLYLSIALIYFLAVIIEYSLKGFIAGTIQKAIIPILISMPLGIIAISAAVFATGSLYLKRTISVEDIVKHVFHRSVSLIGSNLIVRLILALGLMSFSLSAVLAFRSSGVSILIGFIAIPFSIYLIINWIFHIPVILFEKNK